MHTTESLNEYRMTIEITKKYDSKLTILASSPEEAQRIAEIEAIKKYAGIQLIPKMIEASAHVDKVNPYVLRDRLVEQAHMNSGIIR